MARSARTGSSEDQGKREASPGQENTQQGRCVLSRSLDVMVDPSVHASDQQTTKALLKGGVVGAGGVEPPAPSVSGGSGAFEEQGDATPCFTAPQMAGPIGHGTVVYREAA